MLEHLFGSKTRVKLMKIFINNQDKSYFIRELTRIIDTQINAVRREIDNLIQFGMIIELAENNNVKRPGLKRKYYTINKTFPLLNELTVLITKSMFLLDNPLDKELVQLGDIHYLSFLGRFINKPESSIDLFIVADNIDKNQLNKVIYEAEKRLGFDIRFTVLTLKDYQYRQDIADKFLSSVQSAPQQIIIDKITSIK